MTRPISAPRSSRPRGVRITLRAPRELRRRLRSLASRLGIGASELHRRALDAGMDLMEEEAERR